MQGDFYIRHLFIFEKVLDILEFIYYLYWQKNYPVFLCHFVFCFWYEGNISSLKWFSNVLLFYSGESVNAQPGVPNSVFKVGDKVRCNLDLEILKQMQEGHGGWNPRMADVCRTINL